MTCPAEVHADQKYVARTPLSAFRFPLSAFRFPLSAFRFQNSISSASNTGPSTHVRR